MMNLSGKVALVTGGTSGIGKAISTKLAQAGASVIIHYNQAETNAFGLSDKLQSLGYTTSTHQADITKLEEVKELVDQTIKRYGKIDILINNAGITRDQLLLKMTEDDFDQVIKVCLKGTWNMIRMVSPLMSKQRYGRIINVSSISGIIGNAGQSNYSAAKAGMIGLTKSVAREFAKRNITCNAIAPGMIDTRMTEDLPAELKEKYMGQIPVGRFGKPEDVAILALFLASDESSYITGQTIHVDGGMVMN